MEQLELQLRQSNQKLSKLQAERFASDAEVARVNTELAQLMTTKDDIMASVTAMAKYDFIGL